METNFSNRVQTIIQFSREEALRLGHDYIGTEHLLLGLIREGGGVAVKILGNLGANLDEIKCAVEDAVKSTGETIRSVNIPFTKRAEKILKMAYVKAERYKSYIIDAEHLLLALVSEDEGVAAQVLLNFDITYDAVREELENILQGTPSNKRTPLSTSLRKSESSSTSAVGFIDESPAITPFKDGAVYELPKLKFRDTVNVFSAIALTDSLVFKKPREAWFRGFRRHIRQGERSPFAVRFASAEEMNINTLLAKFPEFGDAYEQNVEHAHFLMAHKLQYERIRGADCIRIPPSRFILVKEHSFWFQKGLLPVIVQEKVPGTPLIEMFDEAAQCIRPQWIRFLSKINSVLKSLIGSSLCNHFNWYIGNFLYDRVNNVLYYVDPKPSCIFGKPENEHNIQALQAAFFESEWQALY